MSWERPPFLAEPLYPFRDENADAAEAVEVIEHAIRRMKRGGRRGGHGRRPSMFYSRSKTRNPRECLGLACGDLGFDNFAEAKSWFQSQPIDPNNKLSLNIAPRPINIEDFDSSITHPVVQLDYPRSLSKFLSHLNRSDVADVRPLFLGVRDARGTRSKLMMRIMSDPRPDDRESVVFDGRLIMRRGQPVHCLDGETHAIFPGHMARVHVDPAQNLRHVEFLDVIPDNEY